MQLIRPVASKDLDELIALASETGYGLTTLPQDPEFLGRRIRESELNFSRLGERRPRGEPFLFVLEDLATRAIIGTCGIVPKVGGFEPFYAYRIDTAIHESEIVKIRKEVKTLHLVAEHDGPSELVSLFLSPKHRGRNVGRFLSLSRFLFLAEFPQNFEETIIAEIRGVIDEKGRPPFWDAIGRHFFEIDFQQSDYLSLLNKKIIADLMPTHPIYVPLLPEDAQKVIGVPHADSKGAARILEAEGMRFSGMVDIFDGGPILTAPVNSIRTVRESARHRVIDVVDDRPGSATIVSTVRDGFRAVLGTAHRSEEGLAIGRAVAHALGIGKGEWVRSVELR